MLALVVSSVPAIWNGWRSTCCSRSASVMAQRFVVDVVHQHRELVAAQARHDVARPHVVLDAPRHLDQEFVAGRSGPGCR